MWVWEARPDEHYQLPVPDLAERFIYATGQPDAEQGGDQ